MAKAILPSRNNRALVILTATVVSAAIVAALYWGRAVLIPFALAIYLTFLLSPVVKTLQRWGLRRLPSVLVVSVLAGVIVLAVGWVVVGQCTSFIDRLPDYTGALQKKIQSLKAMTESPGAERLNKMVQDLGDTWKPASKEKPTDQPDPIDGAAHKPVPVVIESARPGWVDWLPNVLSPAMELFAQAGLVIVLAIFMLLSREELRNRFLRLIGHGHMTLTTKAVDDASQRISRFLIVQLLINIGFGVAIAVGLSLLGVELAPLWGFLCAVLRYVPYIGAPVAILFPLAVSVSLSDNWLIPVLVVSMYIVLELITANVLEPLLFGQSVGVSSVALLVTAAFWFYLWGPVGLVLACPLTVCLVVLGKHVPRLEFLAILLDDEPSLAEDISLYQRLLARDQDEAAQIALNQLATHPLQDVFDGLLVPALSYSRRDHLHGGVSDEDLQFIHEATGEILDELTERKDNTASKTTADIATACPPTSTAVRILAIPAHNADAELSLKMLQAVLDSKKWELRVVTKDVLPAEIEELVAAEQPALVCLAAFLPGSLSHTRYLCKRLRARFPELQLLVGLWGRSAHGADYEQRLRDAGVTHVETSLQGVRSYLEGWRPPLLERQTADSERCGGWHGDCNEESASTTFSSSSTRNRPMAQMKDKVKDTIDKAATKAKAATEKIADKTKEAATRIGQKTEDFGKKIKQHGK